MKRKESQFNLPSLKQERQQELKLFIYKRLKTYWDKLPKQVAEFEKNYVREAINSL